MLFDRKIRKQSLLKSTLFRFENRRLQSPILLTGRVLYIDKNNARPISIIGVLGDFCAYIINSLPAKQGQVCKRRDNHSFECSFESRIWKAREREREREGTEKGGDEGSAATAGKLRRIQECHKLTFVKPRFSCYTILMQSNSI